LAAMSSSSSSVNQYSLVTDGHTFIWVSRSVSWVGLFK
jgi:hypothetical protein